jgi:hypothetical protein
MKADRSAAGPGARGWWTGVSAVALACSGSVDAPVPGSRDSGLGGVVASGGSGPLPSPSDAGSSGGSRAVGSDAGSSAGSATGGAGGSTSTRDEPVCDAVTQVFMQSCGFNSCHGNPGATIGDFAVGRAEAEAVVDQPSSRNPACGLLIDSNDPARSLLVRKLTGDFPTSICGGLMPVIGRDLTRAEIDCVASWVTQFAR